MYRLFCASRCMLNWLRKLWPFPWPWKPEDVPEPTHPILLIPGICGTQLAVRDKKDETKNVVSRVWVCIEHAVCQPSLWAAVGFFALLAFNRLQVPEGWCPHV